MARAVPVTARRGVRVGNPGRARPAAGLVQTALPLPPPRRRGPACSGGAAPDLNAYRLIVVCTSAGKDSLAMLAHVCRLIEEQDYRGRVVVLHNHLGVTGSGEPVEWPGVEAAAREHAAAYGLEFVTVTRNGGGLWHQVLVQRRRWMSNNARFCTSDQKTGPAMAWVTRAVAEVRAAERIPAGQPVPVLYCLGLRAQESPGRAAQPLLQVDRRQSSRNRTITRWLPIHGWSIAEVWAEIRRAGLRPHAGYSWGLARLSCALCVLASLEDLMLAAALRPALAADYRAAELELGQPFTERLSMGEILAGLDAARAEAAGDPAAADAALLLYGLVRDRLAATPQARGEGVTKSGKARTPWTAATLAARAGARTAEVLAAARRAVELAARADTSQVMAPPLDEAAETALVAAARR
ncbi:phosphoadenosine phosphosulfate reductase family protein [Microbispora cellulosiformans]|uniref:Phosphoadenosine phosphosulfate reductase family protein n=1 Tax=Microbispora cellulosiformans TaxID=2614688 RepID=A0A5J5K5C4_9ACTN|nr:phosphoadenosine phosphosulfate reductase family protein [Microbispora cellulosiformans]KAA9379672.1 phosphoadenosine phosphosulfate reductase family protein [Microbispora cellulosiformans]